jgi:UDP-N-acetylglucosamine:LPS N-acetylglucosamine transferase
VGCGAEKPEEHMLEALQKHAKRMNLIPNVIHLQNATCGSASSFGNKSYYDCSVRFTETDISGATYSRSLNVVLVKDASDWYLATK